MREHTTRVQRWPEGILRSGRAVAFLTLASGINGIVATQVGGWDPRWLYVATVGVIAALDGWLIGVVAAIGAVIAFQLMSFGRFALAPERDSILLAAAIVAAIVARAMRVSISRPPLPAPKPQPLLTGITAVPVELHDDTRIAAAVRQATDALRNALEEERTRSERERALRREDEQRSRLAIDELTMSVQRTKGALEDLQSRHDELQRSHGNLQGELERVVAGAHASAESVADHERAEEQLRTIVRDAESLRDAAETRANDLQRSADELRAVVAHSRMAQRAAEQRVTELEQANVQLRAVVDELTASHGAASARGAEAEFSRDQLRTQLSDAEDAGRSAAERASALEQEIATIRNAADANVQQWRERVALLEAEIAHQKSAFEQQRFRLENEWNEKLARNAVELTDRFNTALLQADGRADAARTAGQQRIEELQRELLATQSRVDELQQAVAAAQSRADEVRTEVEAEWRQRLQREVADVTAMYNQAVTDAEARAEAALAESTRLSEQLAALLREEEGHRKSHERVQALEREKQSLAAHIEQLESEVEHLGIQVVEAESLQQQIGVLAARLNEVEELNAQLQASDRSGILDDQVRTHTARIAELESEAEMLRRIAEQQRTRSEAEWSEKFTRSAMEITQRFHSELAAANARAEEIEGDAQRLQARVLELEHERQQALAAFDEEKAALEAEWTQKLQTIVNHLASDHDADMGRATLEREEARAEARGLATKLSKIEANVQEMSKAYEELMARDDILRREADEQRREAARRKQQADELNADWNAKLAANALELTQRFNGAMVAADTRLQQANREAENLASRVRELEGIIANLRTADEQRRAAIDAEWSEKLQTIVNHLASDHETDIGQAFSEREEARAEARMYSSKAAALQKTLEAERESQGKSNTEWMAERSQLLGTIDSLRRRLGLGTSAGTVPVPVAAPPEGGRPSVVIVHRDSAVRAIAKHALESTYDVTTAADGLEAFRVALSQRPAVILAEAQMPKMDGRELVQMLKSRPETAAVKIVLMSTNAENGSAAGDYRADDFLRDPANVEALRATLANVLAARV